MVKKILSIFNKESNGVQEAAILLGSLTLLSQILGLFRDKSLAHYIGPSATLDVYYAAFRVPDLLYVSFGSLVSITVLIPFLLEKIRADEVADVDRTPESTARTFLSDAFTSFLFLIVVAAALAFVLMPWLAHLVAPGFTTTEMKEFVAVSRIMLLSPILLGLSNLLGTVTQLYKKFFLFSLSPVFYNLGIIAGTVFFYPLWGVRGLAYGVLLGSLLHLLLQLPTVWRERLMPRISRSINFAEMKRVAFVSLPRTLALALNNLAVLIILSIASTLGDGAISVFSFSYNLQAVPLAIIGVSYSVAAFPMLARYFNEGDMRSFTGNILTAAQQIVFWSMPIVFLFIVLRAQIVRVILGSGSFSWSDTRLVAASLALFSLSVIAQSINLLIVRAYYAAGRTKKPLSINFIFSLSIVIFAFVFLWLYRQFDGVRYFFEALLRVADVPETAALMLPLAYSVGTLLNAFALWRTFKRDFAGEPLPLARTLLQSLGASLVLGAVSYGALMLFGALFDINTFSGIFLQGFLAGLAGIGAWIFILWILKNDELIAFWSAVHRKFWKAPVIAPEHTELMK